MDIVDSQIHIGPGGIDEAVSAMDAVGVRGALIDEYWRAYPNMQPHHPLAGGSYRPISPTAELASQLHPERFSWVLRMHRADPEYASIVRQVRDAPGGRAVRIIAGVPVDELKRFDEGEYDHICAAALENGLPVFVTAPDSPASVARCARKFSDLRLIVDHCGLFSNPMRKSFGRGARERNESEQLELFDEVLALADFPNVAMKWGHATSMFDVPAWPGKGLWPILRKAISRFGADRIIWASDFSVNERGESYGELLFGMRANEDMTPEEKALVLGGSLRHWIDWPAEQPAQ